MTNEQIQKLVKLQEQKERVENIYKTLGKAKTFTIVPVDSNNYNTNSFRSAEIPNMSEELTELFYNMIGDHLAELHAELNSLVLCKEDGNEPKFKPVNNID